MVPIPISVLNKLRSLTFAFLWGSTRDKHRYHLVNWEHLTWPNASSGWGIKNIYWFSIALRAKNFWMVLHNRGLWHHVLLSKYLKSQSIMAWLREKHFTIRQVSMIWKGFIHTLPWIGKCLAWQVGNGMDILLGIDPIIGTLHNSGLPSYLREYLEDPGITTLSQAHNIMPGQQPYWYTSYYLNIDGEWKLLWENYTSSLEGARIRLSPRSDILVWDYNHSDGSVTAELVYDNIIYSSSLSIGIPLQALI